MHIYIDTTQQNIVKVILNIKGNEYVKASAAKNHRDQFVLPIINEMLIEHKAKITDIKSVSINPGPGSFTGIRVGMSIANAISYALGLKDIPKNL